MKKGRTCDPTQSSIVANFTVVEKTTNLSSTYLKIQATSVDYLGIPLGISMQKGKFDSKFLLESFQESYMFMFWENHEN